MPFLYDVCNVKLPLHAKGLAWSRGSTPKKTFCYFLYVFLIGTKACLRIIRGINRLPLPRNIIFFETCIWPFYGQSFIKTIRVGVRGP